MSLPIRRLLSFGHELFPQKISRTNNRGSLDLQFPVEIWQLIFTFLSQSGEPLFPLLTIHSALHREVKCALYRYISLTGDHICHTPHRIALYTQLANQPPLSQTVESFVVAIQDKGLTIGEVKKYRTVLHQALCTMTRLQSLTLTQFSMSPHWYRGPLLPYPVFSGCQFRLRQLNLVTLYGEDFSLVEQQHSVDELTICLRAVQCLSANAFPSLRVLSITSYANSIPTLLSKGERPIQALYWRAYQPRIEDGPFPRIKSLRLEIWDTIPVNPENICTVFPSLRYLRMDFNKQKMSARMAEHFGIMSRLRDLRKLVFGGSGQLELTSFTDRREIATVLLSNIPSLESVSLGLELWQRGKGDDVTFVSNPDEWKDERWLD